MLFSHLCTIWNTEKNRSVFSIMDIVEYITSTNEIKKSTTLTEHFQNPIEKS
jgi:hypothetical protein